jgi:hypothetical protein
MRRDCKPRKKLRVNRAFLRTGSVIGPHFRRGLDDRLITFLLEVSVAFFVGLALFIGLCGFLDTRLPWPPRPTRQRR